MKELSKIKKSYEEFRNTQEIPKWLQDEAEKEYKRSKKDGDDETISVMDSSMIMGYLAGYMKALESPKHETVEDWENRTGESYPDDAPVWGKKVRVIENNNFVEYWELKTYKETISFDKYGSTKCKLTASDAIVANHHGKPGIEG